MVNSNNYKVLFRGLSLSLIFIALYHFLVTNLAIVDLHVVTDNMTMFKIYYAAEGEHWSENRVEEVLIRPGKRHYSMRFKNIEKITHLRIDTSDKPTNVKVVSIVFSQAGFSPVKINSPKQFEKIEVGGGVADFSYSKKGFVVKPSSNDPNIFYQLPALQPENIAMEQLFRLLTLVLFAFALAYASKTMFVDLRCVIYMGAVILTLIAVMAGVSKYNTHPDESVHIKAAKYYIDHNQPPVIGDPAIADTYSVYGISRLNSGEISYFFAGKFAKFLSPLGLSDYLAIRFFNVSLFAFLLLIAAYKKPFRILFIPLLLSPQIWYIFSYSNSEGFAMVVIMLIAYQMVVSESAWNRLLDEESAGCRVWELLGIIVLLAGLLLLKVNFYFFGIYIFLYFIWRLLFKKTAFTVRNMMRMVLVALAGISVFVSVRVYDASINDFQKSERILEAREKYAGPLFKPSTPLDRKFFNLQMKDRGVTLEIILKNHRWAEKIFRTSFGEYGYTSIAASYNYYDFVRYLGFVLLGVILFYSIKNDGWQGITLFSITFGSAVFLLVGALYQAWTVDFQAQGRYLLPIVGMVSMFAYHMREKLANVSSVCVLSAMFMVSLYSFVFVALAGIEKLGFALG